MRRCWRIVGGAQRPRMLEERRRNAAARLQGERWNSGEAAAQVLEERRRSAASPGSAKTQ